MSSDSKRVIAMLTDLGLTAQEADTYLALLELEAVSIRKVAEHTSINRGTTYELLKRLVSIGLVSVRHAGQRAYYSAESPEKIYDIIRDKRKDLLAVSQNAQKLIPTLLAQKARPQGRPLVRYYQDDEGVAAILRDVLQTCRSLNKPEYYAYSSGPMRQYIYREFPNFTKKRIDEGIRVKVIAIGEGGDLATYAERKWLPASEGTDISSYSLIYGNKVALISIASDFTPYGVVIEDSGATSMHRLLFEQLWNTI